MQIGISLQTVFNIPANITHAITGKKLFLIYFQQTIERIVFQVITGIGIPVDLELESVTVGWVNKVEYFLPENASNYLNYFNDPFELSTRPIDGFYPIRKKRDSLLEEPKPTENPYTMHGEKGYDIDENEHFEKHQVEAEVVESGTEDDDDEMTEADYWNQEDGAEWFNDIKPKQPKNLAMARWGIYKSIAVLAQG